MLGLLSSAVSPSTVTLRLVHGYPNIFTVILSPAMPKIFKLQMFVRRLYELLTLVLQVGGGSNLPQTRFSHHCTKTAWTFLERFCDFS